jgi:cysteine desulfurase family protein (TIGR01976 family)
VTTAVLDIEAVRARFSALSRPLAFFDGPSGTQVPDQVIEAVAGYLRNDNANTTDHGDYETALRTNELIEHAHAVAGRFLGCSPGEAAFGANMTTLNFAVTRALGRGLTAGDEIVVTRLDHDGNVAPWLELARDLGLVVRFAGIDDECCLDLADLERQLSRRTRVVAFPLASNMAGTLTDAARVSALAHEAGALSWADAVHFAPHGPIDVDEIGADVLLCSPYKFYGPHLGLAFIRAELLERLHAYKARPAPDFPAARRFETGTLAHELLAGFVAAVGYLESVGWEAISGAERSLGERLLERLPPTCRLYGPGSMDGRVSTFAFAVAGHTPAEVAAELGRQGLAVGHGNFYAVELERALDLSEGVVRAGVVHYNTAAEVDRLIAALEAL